MLGGNLIFRKHILTLLDVSIFCRWDAIASAISLIFSDSGLKECRTAIQGNASSQLKYSHP